MWMSSKHTAEIELCDPDAVIYRSVLPELRRLDARSETEIDYDDGLLCLRVGAPDRVALRAAVNTWLRLAETASSVG